MLSKSDLVLVELSATPKPPKRAAIRLTIVVRLPTAVLFHTAGVTAEIGEIGIINVATGHAF